MAHVKEWAKRLFGSLGLVVQRIPKSADGSHTRITPHATYSPWNTDGAFRQAFGEIAGHTLVDEYRCFELWKLVEQAAKLQGGSLIEVGVWRGGTGALIAWQAARCGIRDSVYLCDTFSGIVKAGALDADYTGGEHADTSRETAENLLKRMGAGNARILQGIFPEETGEQVAGERFRFCHIDVDVYDSAKDVLAWIWPRMVQGGIIVYDDYGLRTTGGVTRHVEEQMLLEDRLVFHNLNGHAIVVKR